MVDIHNHEHIREDEEDFPEEDICTWGDLFQRGFVQKLVEKLAEEKSIEEDVKNRFLKFLLENGAFSDWVMKKVHTDYFEYDMDENASNLYLFGAPYRGNDLEDIVESIQEYFVQYVIEEFEEEWYDEFLKLGEVSKRLVEGTRDVLPSPLVSLTMSYYL